MRASPAMLKAVVSARVVDSLPYWDSTLDYLECAVLDLDALRQVVQSYSQSGDDWRKSLQHQGSIDFFPSVRASYFGVQVSGATAVTLVVRSLVHNLHKTFDSLAQFVNAVALADQGLDVDRVNIHLVADYLSQNGGFSDLAGALQDVISDQDRFRYVADLDNILKHIVAIDPDIKWFFLSNKVEAYLPAFGSKRGNRQYPRKPLLSTAEELVTFVSDTLTKFDQIVSTGCGVQWYPVIDNRLHDLSFYVQFEDTDGKHVSGSIQYLRVSDLPAVGDRIKVLSVVETESDGITDYTFHNSPSDTLVLRNNVRVPVAIARASGTVAQWDELPLLEYREYCVTNIGPITAAHFHGILAEPKQVKGRMEQVSYGFRAGEFPATLLSGVAEHLPVVPD
jgi:hypothetical protein